MRKRLADLKHRGAERARRAWTFLMSKSVTRIVTFTFFGIIHVALMTSVPVTPFNIATIIALILPGLIAMWVTRGWVYWYRWVAVAFIATWINPMVSIPTLIVCDVWALRRQRIDYLAAAETRAAPNEPIGKSKTKHKTKSKASK